MRKSADDGAATARNTVIDVGTNVGTVALALARRVGPTGQVYAFEPQRPIFQAVCATLALNGITHVKAFHAAVGTEKGEVQLRRLILPNRKLWRGKNRDRAS